MEGLSVIVPIYNSAKYLEACIQSILMQKSNIEIILIDDGSTDNSGEICKAFAAQHANVHYVYQENSGVSAARNHGVKCANYENIMFVDSDDLLTSGVIEVFMADAKDYDFLMCGYSERYEKTGETVTYQCPDFEGGIRSFVEKLEQYIFPPLLMGPCFKVFKRSIIIENQVEFPLELSYGEDALFVVEYLNYTRNVKCYDYNGYIYRKFDSGTLSSTYRPDRFDINLRINHNIRKLVSNNSENNGDELFNKRTMLNAVMFVKELMVQKMSYKHKKAEFFRTLSTFIPDLEHGLSQYSVAEKLVTLVRIKKMPFAILYIFPIRQALLKGRNI